MDVEIYTKPGCNYCLLAKHLLKLKEISFRENKLDIDFTRQSLIEKYSTAKTYPVIVVDGFYIGGYIELAKMLEHYIAINHNMLLENGSR